MMADDDDNKETAAAFFGFLPVCKQEGH